MLGTSYETFKCFAIMVPRAEATLTTLARSRESAIQLALLIGFVALMIVTGLLFSDPPDESTRKKSF
ncbi:MAG TPA: hypothetical protein VIV60_36370 [Polyangiaceae bacterium]